MHMEQFWKTADARLNLARRDIYTMIDEIMSVYWLDNRGVAIIMAYSDELDTNSYNDKDSWTSIGCSYFRNWIEDVNNDSKVKEVAKSINKNDLIWILRWTKELNNALVKVVESAVTNDLPPELTGMLKWLAEMIGKAVKDSKKEIDGEEEKPKKRKKKKIEGDDDILGGLNKLLQ